MLNGIGAAFAMKVDYLVIPVLFSSFWGGIFRDYPRKGVNCLSVFLYSVYDGILYKCAKVLYVFRS